MRPLIMVIDDDKGITNLLSIILRKHGYTPITASNGSAALEILKHNPLPRLILSDYCMPVLNGCKLTEKLSEQPCLKDIPVVIMTGSAMDCLRVPKTDNFKKIIQKPFNIIELIDIINSLTSAEYTAMCLA